MSISSVLSLRSSIYGGIQSSVFTWIVDRTGVAQNIAKTTAPLLKGAFVFGVINRTVEYASTNLKEKVKKDWFLEEHGLDRGADALQFALTIASRYAVAKLCNRYFGTKITTAFVHIYTASDVIRMTSSLGTISLMTRGLLSAMSAKSYSAFMATPLFNNAFYFGMTSAAAVAAINRSTSKIHAQIKDCLGMEDLRVLYLSRVVLGSVALVSIYGCAKICTQYLNIPIPKNYIHLRAAFAFLWISIKAFFEHIRYDVFKDGFSPVLEKIQSSEDPNLKAITEQLTEIIENMNEVGQDTIQQRLQRLTEGNNAEVLLRAEALLSRQFQTVLWQIFREWAEGESADNMTLSSLEVLASNREVIDPVLGIIRDVVGVTSKQVGANFILNEVLKDASQETKDAVMILDPNRDTVKFIATKAVAIYIVGSKKEKGLPSFFSGDTNAKIEALRLVIQHKPEMKAAYEAVLERLNAATKKEEIEENEDFFAFKSKLTSPNQKAALNELQQIGFSETRSTFLRKCCKIAVQRLNREADA